MMKLIKSYEHCLNMWNHIKWYYEWVTELFNAKRAILQLYHGKNKLRFDEMMMSAVF